MSLAVGLGEKRECYATVVGLDLMLETCFYTWSKVNLVRSPQPAVLVLFWPAQTYSSCTEMNYCLRYFVLFCCLLSVFRLTVDYSSK